VGADQQTVMTTPRLMLTTRKVGVQGFPGNVPDVARRIRTIREEGDRLAVGQQNPVAERAKFAQLPVTRSPVIDFCD
jgi:hypothetical protein